MKDEIIQGLYLPINQTFYHIISTRWTNPQMSIDRLRKILLARGLLDFSSKSLSGETKDLRKYNPIIMTLSQAKIKGYTIEEVYATDNEKTRVEKETSTTENTGSTKPSAGFFRKK